MRSGPFHLHSLSGAGGLGKCLVNEHIVVPDVPYCVGCGSTVLPPRFDMIAFEKLKGLSAISDV